jgi:hypothetical protein
MLTTAEFGTPLSPTLTFPHQEGESGFFSLLPPCGLSARQFFGGGAEKAFLAIHVSCNVNIDWTR